MIKDQKIFLQHILESIETIEKYTAGMSAEQFFASGETQDAVARRLEIIGEATKHLSGELRDQYTSIPWQDVAGMRDVLIHEYFALDLELVWSTVQKDLPVFKTHIQKILSSLP